jgi:hypothetical protein
LLEHLRSPFPSYLFTCEWNYEPKVAQKNKIRTIFA